MISSKPSVKDSPSGQWWSGGNAGSSWEQVPEKLLCGRRCAARCCRGSGQKLQAAAAAAEGTEPLPLQRWLGGAQAPVAQSQEDLLHGTSRANLAADVHLIMFCIRFTDACQLCSAACCMRTSACVMLVRKD